MTLNPKDIIGKTFGYLTVVDRVPPPSGAKCRAYHWRCVCQCGNETIVLINNLRSGSTTSCGCYSRKRSSTANGLCAKYPDEYNVWKLILYRTTNPTSPKFEHYGGRGIRVCQRWTESFAAFIEDMGPRPVIDGRKVHIDRIDNDGNYEPGNCQWITAKANNLKKDNIVWITDPFDGERLCVSDISKKHGLPPGLFNIRTALNWTLEDVLKKPIKHKKYRVFLTDPFDGEKLSMSDIARKYSLKPNVLYSRLKCNWPIEKALTIPINNTHKGTAV